MLTRGSNCGNCDELMRKWPQSLVYCFTRAVDAVPISGNHLSVSLLIFNCPLISRLDVSRLNRLLVNLVISPKCRMWSVLRWWTHKHPIDRLQHKGTHCFCNSFHREMSTFCILVFIHDQSSSYSLFIGLRESGKLHRQSGFLCSCLPALQGSVTWSEITWRNFWRRFLEKAARRSRATFSVQAQSMVAKFEMRLYVEA